MLQAIEQTFLDLCRQVSDAYKDTEDGHRAEPVDTEPYLVALLEFVESHPEQRNTFMQLFLRVANGDIPSPWFLLGFCMHKLRYPEVYEFLRKEYQDGYNRSTFARRINYLRLNLEIFEDKDDLFVQMWPYYSGDTA